MISIEISYNSFFADPRIGLGSIGLCLKFDDNAGVVIMYNLATREFWHRRKAAGTWDEGWVRIANT